MDYFASLGPELASITNEMGTKITITRDGTKVLSALAVFTGITSTKETTSQAIAVDTAVNSAKAYIGGTYSKIPEPGDLLTVGLTQYTVKTVTNYKPAGVSIGMMLELQ